jgi:glycosyltransferase involved in cell wall biosynthesis
MKIVCIAASFVPSNTANSIQVMKAAHALVENGHDVTLLVPGDKAHAWDELAGRYGLTTAFKIIWLPENLFWRRYDFAFKALRQARRLDPDLIYTWMLQSAVLSLRHGFPTVLEMHDRVTGLLGPILFKFFLQSKKAKRLLTITDALRRALEEDFKTTFPSGMCMIAPMGVELERYSNLPDPKKARSMLGLKEGFTAGYSGHFYAGRGMQVLHALAKTFPQVNFLWVGGKDNAVESWKRRLLEEGVANVTLTGFVENASLALYQAACEVLLMPYEQEIAVSGGGNTADICSPMKMFEYMAAGRAIISSDLPVLREVLNENNALFCPTGDLEAWQEALDLLINDTAQRISLADRARVDVQIYSWRSRASKALESIIF